MSSYIRLLNVERATTPLSEPRDALDGNSITSLRSS